jgi:hypothetical protein
VIHAACAKLFADFVRRCEAEICEGHPQPPVEAQHVLGLQVAVVNAEGVAILHCVQQLEEDMLDEDVVPEIAAIMEDLCEQITIAGVVHDDVRVVEVLYDPVEGDDVRMDRCELMEGDFTDVEVALAGGLLLGVGEAFDGIGLGVGGAHVDGTVYYAVATDAEDLDQLEAIVIDEGAERGMDGGGRGFRRHGEVSSTSADS